MVYYLYKRLRSRQRGVDSFMRRFESLKRIIVLELSMLGLLFMTIGYIFVWYNCYYEVISWRLKYTMKGYWLLIALYFMLLIFFSYTYGGTKIGYLKSMDVFFSQAFSVAIVNFITYLVTILNNLSHIFAKIIHQFHIRLFSKMRIQI